MVVTAVGPNFATRHNPRTTMTSPPDLHQRLARTLIAVMKDSAATSRLIAVSTASMGPADNLMGAGPRLLFRFFRTVVAPNLGLVGNDLRAMEEELAASGLDWYAVRPIKLTDGPLTRHVQASDRFAMKAISRADAAWHILALAEDPAPGPTHPSHHHRSQPENAPGRGTPPAWQIPQSGRQRAAGSGGTRQERQTPLVTNPGPVLVRLAWLRYRPR